MRRCSLAISSSRRRRGGGVGGFIGVVGEGKGDAGFGVFVVVGVGGVVVEL